MKFSDFQRELFAEGRKNNITNMEIFQNSSRSFKLRVFEGEIDHYSLSEDCGISLRASIDDKIGYSYSEKLDRESITLLLENVQQNAEINEEDEEIYPGGEEYQDIDPYTQELNNVSPEEKIETVKKMEKAALERDERIKSVNYCLYNDLEFEEKLINTYGLDCSFKNNAAYIYISAVAQKGDQIKTASEFAISQKFKQLNPVQVAKKAADEALSMLGATAIDSGKYPVILRNDTAADLLSAFSSTFSAYDVQKGLSLFAGKLGQKVAAEDITLFDDPFLEQGFRLRPFDAEGVPAYKKEIISEGSLKTFLHNLKTARQEDTKSTGNAYRSSHKSYIDIAPTNMYFKPGTVSRKEMISQIDRGLLITDIQGLHAGANSVSGDFSLSAAGYFIDKGEITEPVEQITIAGNFLEMLQKITVVGKDLRMSIPGSSHIGAPSLMIEEMNVAGN